MIVVRTPGSDRSRRGRDQKWQNAMEYRYYIYFLHRCATDVKSADESFIILRKTVI